MSDEILKPETAVQVAPPTATPVTPNFGTAEFRKWLLKTLKGGGMNSYDIIILAERQLKKKFNEADLAPDKAGKRSHKWMHRLHDARKALVTAGLMHPLKHFATRDKDWWQLTPRGLQAKE